MKTIRSYVLVIVGMMCFNSIIAQPKIDAPTAIGVVNNAITALGGEEYLRSIKTMYTDMATEMEGRQVHWIVREMLPNKGAFQIVYNDRVVFENWFNGTKGFQVSGGIKKEAEPEEFKDKLYRKNIFNELDYIDPTLWKLELLGTDNIGEEECYKIKASMVNGPTTKILCFSKATFYLLMEDKSSTTEKDKIERTLFYGYKSYGKLTYYTEFKMILGNGSQTAKIVKLLPNSMVTDKDFNK